MADLMANEVLDVQDMAEGAEIQRSFFSLITPLGLSWLQPMFPSVAPSTPSSLTPQRNASLGQTLARLAPKSALFCLTCRGRLCIPLKKRRFPRGFRGLCYQIQIPLSTPVLLGFLSTFQIAGQIVARLRSIFALPKGAPPADNGPAKTAWTTGVFG